MFQSLLSFFFKPNKFTFLTPKIGGSPHFNRNFQYHNSLITKPSFLGHSFPSHQLGYASSKLKPKPASDYSNILKVLNEIPQNGNAAELMKPKITPYEILRTKNNNLPVYPRFRSKKMRMFTVLRNYQGDIQLLKTDLQQALGPKALITEYVGRLEVEGDWRPQVVKFLQAKGF